MKTLNPKVQQIWVHIVKLRLGNQKMSDMLEEEVKWEGLIVSAVAADTPSQQVSDFYFNAHHLLLSFIKSPCPRNCQNKPLA